MQSEIAHPRPSHDSQQSATIERLEETATRMSLTAKQPPPSFHPDISLEDQIRSQLTRDTSIRSIASTPSTHSSLYRTSLSIHNGELQSPPAAMGSPLAPSRSFSWSQASGQRSRTNSRRISSRREPEQEGRPLDSLMTGNNGTLSRTPSTDTRRLDQQQFAPQDAADGERSSLYSNPDDQGVQYTREYSRSQDGPVRTSSTASRASSLQAAKGLFRDFDGTHYTPLNEEIVEEEEDDESDVDDGAPLPGSHAKYAPIQHRSSEDFDSYAETVPHGHISMPSNSLYHGSSDRTPTKEHPHGREVSTSSSRSRRSFPVSPPGIHGDSQHSEQTEARTASEWAIAAPPDGMIYYPARIPVTLNLPKRLSRQPVPHLQNQRRSQLMSSLPSDTRKSVPWLPPIEGINDPQAQQENDEDRPQAKKRQSTTVDLKKLPPQLRASIFFDQAPIKHTPPVRDSVVLSLDQMLDDGATTPAGMPVSMAAGSRSSTSLVDEPRSSNLYGSVDLSTSNRRKSRLNLSSSTLGFNVLEERAIQEEPNEHRSVSAESIQRNRQSDLSFINFDGEPGPVQHDRVEQFHESAAKEVNHAYDEGQLDDEPVIVQPTTLLAELQLRKTEMRSRNRNAANGFPRGMHSTLMQLDAVAQIEEKRRKAQKTKLAWEGQEYHAGGTAQDEDDDVPLGLLFPGHAGLVARSGPNGDKDRPLGLMEKREIEDNEPLSKRRNRILGIPSPSLQPQTPSTTQMRRNPVPVIAVEERRNPMFEQDDEEANSNETLAQRHRRLRSSRVLDEAIGQGSSALHGRAISDDFASEMMSQFGGLERPENKGDVDRAADPAPEEETLGQRRRRLQAEREKAASSSDLPFGEAAKPGLRSARSLANILGENPVTRNRQHVAESQEHGFGLVGASDVAIASRRQALLDRNIRASGHAGMNGPLIDLPPGGKSAIDFRGEVARERASFAKGHYNDGTGGYGLRAASPNPTRSLNRQPSAMSLGMGSMNGLNAYMQGLSLPMTPSSQQNPGYTRPGYSTHQDQPQLGAYGGIDVSSLDVKQREQIERWRQNVLE